MPKQKAEQSPAYKAGVQAGFNKKSGRFHTTDGKIATREKALEENTVSSLSDTSQGIRLINLTPISNALGKFEVMTSGMKDAGEQYSGIANVIQAALNLASDPEGKRPANYMLPQVQSRMRLAEYYYQTEGDATGVCDVPVELMSRRLVVDCPDTGLRSDIEDFIVEHNLEELVGELWRTTRVYGQAFPFECWSDNNKDLLAVVNLYPLHVHIGYHWGFIGPEMIGEKTWSEALIQSRLPPALHKPLLRHWNENPPPDIGLNSWAQGAPLDGELLKPIRDRDFNWARYSMPMLSRGFRDLTSRIVHEDAVRAVTEGYKYQLIVFKLGDADHPPSPKELGALRSVLTGINGERTGTLVWRNPLEVEIIVPEGLDKLMGNDYLGYLTKSFFRKMGITSQVLSGETPGTLGSVAAGGRSTSSIDVTIYIERSRYQADQVTRWIEYLVKKWGSANSRAKKALSKTRIRFAPTQFEMETRIKEVMLPMYESGVLSARTLYGSAGLTYEAEIANKTEEKKARDGGLLDPPATYKQISVTPEGTSSTTQRKSEGSPDAVEELKNRIKKESDTEQRNNDALQKIAASVQQQPQYQPVFNLTMPEQSIAMPNIVVNTPAQQVDVHVPASNITVEAAEAQPVNVFVPRQEPPQVTVQAASQAPVHVDVHVPEQAAPVVNVAAAEVNIPEQKAPVVNVDVAAAQVNVPKYEQPSIVVNVPAQETPIVNVNVAAAESPAPIVNVIVPETEEEIEVTERNIDGSMKRAKKTRRKKAD